MKSTNVLSFLTAFIINGYSFQQTTTPPNQPSCIHYIDALQCFQNFGTTSHFTEAKEICQTNQKDLPIIAEKLDRQIVVNSSIPLNMMPFWLDLRSLTNVTVFITGHTVDYTVCAVGRAPRTDNELISFDYCFKERQALCCKRLACYPTQKKFSWEQAVRICESQNQTMYGIGATIAEIRSRFRVMPYCPDCWIGLNTTVTSNGFRGSQLVDPSPGLNSIPRPGPCAVVERNGEGRSVPCNGNTSYHIICEKYVRKVLLTEKAQKAAKITCPPDGCNKQYPRGGNTRMTSAIIFTAGLPICISVGIAVGVVHRRRNPIYNRMHDRQSDRRPSQASYIPGGANTMF